MIFSQLGSYFGRPGRQGVDGNLTGLFFIDARSLQRARGRNSERWHGNVSSIRRPDKLLKLGKMKRDYFSQRIRSLAYIRICPRCATKEAVQGTEVLTNEPLFEDRTQSTNTTICAVYSLSSQHGQKFLKTQQDVYAYVMKCFRLPMNSDNNPGV